MRKEFKVKIAGYGKPEYLIFEQGNVWQCGEIKDGYAVRFDGYRGGFVIDSNDLKQAIKAMEENQK